MFITRLEQADDDGVRGCYSAAIAARAADDALNPPQSLASFAGWLRFGWEGTPSEAWYAPPPDAPPGSGTAAGYYRLELPDLENRHRAFVFLEVHPGWRRRGIGTALLRHAAARAAANGRSMLASAALTGSAGEAFARHFGAEFGIVDERRVLDLTTLPAGRLADLRAGAAERAAGYTLVRWTGPVPEEHLGRVAGTFNAMNDAPREEGWFEDDIWDAERVRERASAWLLATGTRGYSVAALHDMSGEMAGLTQVFVDPEFPSWAHQGLTAVTKPHRGHRLGLLLKATMLEWLGSAEPALERIITDNAAPNSFMISVNETLGYRLAPPGRQFYQFTVTSLS